MNPAFVPDIAGLRVIKGLCDEPALEREDS